MSSVFYFAKHLAFELFWVVALIVSLFFSCAIFASVGFTVYVSIKGLMNG